MAALQLAGSSSKVPAIAIKPAACTTLTYAWRCRMAGKSISVEHRRRTSDIRICRSQSMMRSNARAGNFRITRGAWRGRSRATRGNPSEPWCDLIPAVNSDFFDQATARRSISIATVFLAQSSPNWILVREWCFPKRSAKKVHRPLRSSFSENTRYGSELHFLRERVCDFLDCGGRTQAQAAEAVTL